MRKATLKEFTLHKQERLKSRKLIDGVFAKGLSVSSYPLRLVWVEAALQTTYTAQLAISVPKRNFKHATNRNTLKRRIREAYRLNKAAIYNILQQQNKQYALVLIYTGREAADYALIEKKLLILLQKFADKCNETPA